MEVQVKPRVVYAQTFAVPQAKDIKGTVAWILERYIREMNGLDGRPAVKTLGNSHECTLGLLQRWPIGAVMATELRKQEVIEHCRERNKDVEPPTVMQDMTFLSGALKYAGSAWDDCEGVSDAAVAAAKPFLIKHRLICKSIPRERRVEGWEHASLLAFFAVGNLDPRTKIDMVKVARWQIASARRISETCRLLWTDWDREAHTILVRKMKDPRTRDKNKVVALTPAAQAMLVALWDERDPNEPRIFPYNPHSCSAKYTAAKKELGIVDLHLHDSRAECGTRLIEDDGYSPAEAILVTGHETTTIFERTYMRMKPENFKLGPIAKRKPKESGNGISGEARASAG